MQKQNASCPNAAIVVEYKVLYLTLQGFHMQNLLAQMPFNAQMMANGPIGTCCNHVKINKLLHRNHTIHSVRTICLSGNICLASHLCDQPSQVHFTTAKFHSKMI